MYFAHKKMDIKEKDNKEVPQAPAFPGGRSEMTGRWEA